MSSPKVPSEIAAGIAKFDASQLKHTDTQEKNPLPSQEGEQMDSWNTSKFF